VKGNVGNTHAHGVGLFRVVRNMVPHVSEGLRTADAARGGATLEDSQTKCGVQRQEVA